MSKTEKNLYCFLTSKSTKSNPSSSPATPTIVLNSYRPFLNTNTSHSLTVINHSSLSQTQKPTSPKTILSNTNHHHHNKHCPVPTATFFTHFLSKKKTQQLPTTQTIKLSPALTLFASTNHLYIEEILLLLRLRDVAGMIDLEMIKE
jgi:hypothetical protein